MEAAKQAGNQPIDPIGFSTRVANVLRAIGVTRLEEIARRSELDPCRLPNLGKECIREIREVLEAHELSFGMTFVPAAPDARPAKPEADPGAELREPIAQSTSP